MSGRRVSSPSPVPAPLENETCQTNLRIGTSETSSEPAKKDDLDAAKRRLKTLGSALTGAATDGAVQPASEHGSSKLETESSDPAPAEPPTEALDLIKKIEALMTDIRFAAAEGGSEVDETRTRYGKFFVKHGDALVARLRAAALQDSGKDREIASLKDEMKTVKTRMWELGHDNDRLDAELKATLQDAPRTEIRAFVKHLWDECHDGGNFEVTGWAAKLDRLLAAPRPPDQEERQ